MQGAARQTKGPPTRRRQALSTSSKPVYPIPQVPDMPPSSKDFSRRNSQGNLKSSHRGRRVRSKSPTFGRRNHSPVMKTATVSVSPSLSIADFGIGARTAIKTRPSPSTNYDTTTRMAASRSLPNSPRLLQYSNDTNIIVRPTA